MGKIKQGILGGFSGRVANVVGTSWKGRAVIKSRPISVSNPKTAGQVSQRTSFKGAALVGAQILTAVIRALYNPTSGNISGYNQFTKLNKQMYDGVGTFVPANTTIGAGSLIHNQLDGISLDGSNQDLVITWAADSGGDPARLDDTVVAWVIEPISGQIWVTKTDNSRDDESVLVSKFKAGSDLSSQLQVYGYIGFVSPDGRLTSVQASGFGAQVDFGS